MSETIGPPRGEGINLGDQHDYMKADGQVVESWRWEIQPGTKAQAHWVLVPQEPVDEQEDEEEDEGIC